MWIAPEFYVVDRKKGSYPCEHRRTLLHHCGNSILDRGWFLIHERHLFLTFMICSSVYAGVFVEKNPDFCRDWCRHCEPGFFVSSLRSRFSAEKPGPQWTNNDMSTINLQPWFFPKLLNCKCVCSQNGRYEKCFLCFYTVTIISHMALVECSRCAFCGLEIKSFPIWIMTTRRSLLMGRDR